MNDESKKPLPMHVRDSLFLCRVLLDGLVIVIGLPPLCLLCRLFRRHTFADKLAMGILPQWFMVGGYVGACLMFLALGALTWIAWSRF